jgi:hypothetical protein
MNGISSLAHELVQVSPVVRLAAEVFVVGGRSGLIAERLRDLGRPASALGRVSIFRSS